MQAGKARASLTESAGPELEFKVSNILEDEAAFLVTRELNFEPLLR